MKVQPLGDRILAKRLDPEKAVKGGIIIPDTAKEKPLEAKVISVGPGKFDDNGKRVAMEIARLPGRDEGGISVRPSKEPAFTPIPGSALTAR